MHVREPFVRYKLTVAQYEKMGRDGVLDPRDRVELIDGEIVQMSPIGSDHASCVNRLATTLIVALFRALSACDGDHPEPDGARQSLRATT